MTQGEKSIDTCPAWQRCLEEDTKGAFPLWVLKAQQLSVKKQANATSFVRCMESKEQEPAAFLGRVAQEGGKGSREGVCLGKLWEQLRGF